MFHYVSNDSTTSSSSEGAKSKTKKPKRPDVVFFNAGCNEQVFSPRPMKKFGTARFAFS